MIIKNKLGCSVRDRENMKQTNRSCKQQLLTLSEFFQGKGRRVVTHPTSSHLETSHHFPLYFSVGLQTWEKKQRVCLCFDFIFRMGITTGVDVAISPPRLLAIQGVKRLLIREIMGDNFQISI